MMQIIFQIISNLSRSRREAYLADRGATLAIVGSRLVVGSCDFFARAIIQAFRCPRVAMSCWAVGHLLVVGVVGGAIGSGRPISTDRGCWNGNWLRKAQQALLLRYIIGHTRGLGQDVFEQMIFAGALALKTVATTAYTTPIRAATDPA